MGVASNLSAPWADSGGIMSPLARPVFSGGKPFELAAGCFAPKAGLLARPSRYSVAEVGNGRSVQGHSAEPSRSRSGVKSSGGFGFIRG